MPLRTPRRTVSTLLTALILIATALVLGNPGPAAAAINNPVRTASGLVRGAPGTADPSVTAFRGIPYAASPTGDLRWRAPAKPASWTGVRDTTTFGDSCP